MRALISPRRFSGTLRVPASKSHTIRRLILAALSGGVSDIEYPLDSLDARSCVAVCRGLGAEIGEYRSADPRCPNPADEGGKRLLRWRVRGRAGGPAGRSPDGMAAADGARPGTGAAEPLRLDAGNSGTTLYLAMAAAALGSVPVEFTGDEQIRRRSAAPLLEALSGLGARAESKQGNGCAPLVIQGPWKGGRISLPCPTSQYLSALLIAAPLAPAGTMTEIDVPLLNERPYIRMTLSYLDAQGVSYEAAEDLSRFRVPGGASYRPMNGPVPGDFSSAAFPAAAAAVSGGGVTLLGLDPADTQGDKSFFDFIAEMGCDVKWEQNGEWALTLSRRRSLRGGTFDLNATPDLLPVMAVMGACAGGDTDLVNVAHARIKETDRIAVMAAELAKLGVKTTERPDGLVIHGGSRDGPLRPLSMERGAAPLPAPANRPVLDGHGDHRVVMALACLAAVAGPLEIDSAESAAVTWPGFLELLGAG
jgi:3-phosphoshikimate 1-carboxyvinyltransferase